MSDSCPACRDSITIAAPIRCARCGWNLVTLAKWKKLSPLRQGWVLYMEADWPTSELAGQRNPYAEGTPKWAEFCRGEMLAVRSAQDGEE